MTMPSPEIVETRAEHEVDEVLDELRDAMLKHLDARTVALIRDVMILSWQRGAAFMAQHGETGFDS